MTMMANDHQASSTKDAEDLFIKLSVPDLNVYERKIRTDIEKKKQELRTMVGERYRDLIGAADRIVRMKETALQVQSNMAKMRESCDVHALKRRVAAQVATASSSSEENASGGREAVDGTKKAFYSSAAQIKLLVDAPEQIWRNMENHNYLTASRLYLISQAIHQNLRPDEGEVDEQKKRVMESFPVVGRQWDAVRHFRAQILNKSKQRLREEGLSDQVVIETLSAIMLLDHVTVKDLFALLLKQRQEAIRDILQHKGQKDIGAQLVQAIQTFKATLFHIDAAFRATGADQPSRLERHLRHLEKTFSSPTEDIATGTQLSPPSAPLNDLSTDTTATLPSLSSAGFVGGSSGAGSTVTTTTTTQSVIPPLYPTTPNVHLLVRYLPESVQTLRPTMALEVPLSQEEMHGLLQAWVDETLSVFADEFERLLQRVSTTKALVRTRRAVWDAIRQDELELVKKQQRRNNSKVTENKANVASSPSSLTRKSSSSSSWDNVCQSLLSRSLSLWETVLRSGFRKAFQDTIVFSLEELSKQPQTILRARLAELDNAESPDRDVGRFIWHENQNIASTTTNTTNTSQKKMGAPSLSASAAAANASLLTTATGPLAARIRECVSGWTPMVADMGRLFETQLLDVRLDQETVLVLSRRDVYGSRIRPKARSSQPQRRALESSVSWHRSTLQTSSSATITPATTAAVAKGRSKPAPHDTRSERGSDSDSSEDDDYGDLFDEEYNSDDDSKGEEEGDEDDDDHDARLRRWAESDGEGLFGVVADHEALLAFYQARSMECIDAYRANLVKLVQEALQKPETARHTVTAMDRAMAIGRLAACLAALTPFIRQVLLPPAVEQQQQQLLLQQKQLQRRSGGAPQGGRENKAKVADEYAQRVAQGFREVYLTAHQAWVEHMGWLFNKRLEDAYLYDRLTCASVWSSDLATLSWEPMASASTATLPLSPASGGRSSLEVTSPTTSSSANTAGKTLLPFHASTKLMMVLEGVVQEMHRIGAGSMRPDLIQRLITQLATVAYEALDRFMDTVMAADGSGMEGQKTKAKKNKKGQEEENPVITLTEKGALQLLFDVKYMQLCFNPNAGLDDNVIRLATSVQDRVKQHIDPINLEVFEGPIDKNVDQQYQRTWTMLGLLVQLNKKPVQSARKKVEAGAHHVLAMAPLSTRFTLLPIGQKMPSGRIV
ncbi:Golgi transport complex subunit 1 [Actinomortierella ambigua]|nr:Golgi transport complex subunit 1 [Actinomortierella ambigua]